MVMYWVVGYTLFLFSCYEVLTTNGMEVKERKKDPLVILLFIAGVALLIVFGGIRGPMSGVDDDQYKQFYYYFIQQIDIDSLGDIKDKYRYEPVFIYLAYISSFITKNSNWFLLFVCFFAVNINAITFKKYSPLILVSLCLYSVHLFINKDMNQIRFGISSAFAVASFCYLSQDKYTKALILFVCCILSHNTGYAAILMVPFLFIKERRYLPLIIILCAIPIGIVGGKSLFLNYFSLIPGVGIMARNYVGGEFDGELSVFGLANLKNILFIAVFCFYILRDITEPERFKLYYILILAYAIGGAIRIIFSDFSIIGGRVGNLFLHAEPILMAIFLSKLKNKFMALGFFFLFISYFLTYNTIIFPQSIFGYSVSQTFDAF
ncbi:EpsG family protein [Serratia marcescens]|uniref:EpsG family protein n=3 Tax=Serratia marcescens TaxID=615 RepID=A0ABX5NFM1_SERMA|nr:MULTISPECIES: EpsG family protein [Serratia]MDI9106501.1 EpsG family protein [Serratia marcescens]MDR8492114.1 EpsG family protein [Serratia nevei]MDR8536505.1 EpsG family protein [Serratia nevei]PXZ99075.1 EpsG family protein [Serratia marcescens]PYA12258.1 EpsG family protein [Serratia marcescens]